MANSQSCFESLVGLASWLLFWQCIGCEGYIGGSLNQLSSMLLKVASMWICYIVVRNSCSFSIYF